MDARTAAIDLEDINAETLNMDKTDYLVFLGNKGIPISILTRLEALWDVTRKLGKTIINLGRIIIAKIVEFVMAHPHAAIGMAIGAVIGAFVSAVPFLGPLLAPISAALGAAYGYCVGLRLDYSSGCEPRNEFEALILLAKDFIKLIAEILLAVKDSLFGENKNG